LKGTICGCHPGDIDFPPGLDKDTAMQRWLSHGLAAFILVLSQTVLLVHQADIDAHSHGDNCSVCLLVHGLDSALPTQFAALPCTPVSSFPVTEQVPGHARQTRNVYLARAPPTLTHPVV
jgi:hypothetical protein